MDDPVPTSSEPTRPGVVSVNQVIAAAAHITLVGLAFAFSPQNDLSGGVVDAAPLWLAFLWIPAVVAALGGLQWLHDWEVGLVLGSGTVAALAMAVFVKYSFLHAKSHDVGIVQAIIYMVCYICYLVALLIWRGLLAPTTKPVKADYWAAAALTVVAIPLLSTSVGRAGLRRHRVLRQHLLTRLQRQRRLGVAVNYCQLGWL